MNSVNKNKKHYGDGSIVSNGVCSCKFRKEFNMDCKHMFQATNRVWYDRRFTGENYENMYSCETIVVRSESMVFSEPDAVHPFSSSKRMPGRPKTARIRPMREKAMKKAVNKARREEKENTKHKGDRKEEMNARDTKKALQSCAMETRASSKRKGTENARKRGGRNASGLKRKRGSEKGEGNTRKRMRTE